MITVKKDDLPLIIFLFAKCPTSDKSENTDVGSKTRYITQLVVSEDGLIFLAFFACV